MKKNYTISIILLLFMSILLNGCTKLYVMTEAEKEQIVIYSAKVVSKFNRSQGKGYSYVSNANKERFYRDQGIITDEDSGDSTTDSSSGFSANEDESTSTKYTTNDILGQDGVTLDYVSYDVSKSYESGDITLSDAGEGNNYLILHFDMVNNTENSFTVDLINNVIKYKLNISADDTLDAISTLSMDDLSTYYNRSFEAGGSADVVLIFGVTDAQLASLDRLVLNVTRAGNTFDVNLQ